MSYTAEEHAKDVIELAYVAGMPDSFWVTDSRIRRALSTLGWTAEFARTWAMEGNRGTVSSAQVVVDLHETWNDRDSHIRQARFRVRHIWPRLADALDAL